MDNACTNDTLICGCNDDKFALLGGAAAQYAYFLGYGQDFCRRRAAACSVCDHGAIFNAKPECKLGFSLASRNVSVLDLRHLTTGHVDNEREEDVPCAVQ